MLRDVERIGRVVLDAIAGILVVAIAGVLLLQVVGRYVLAYPFAWPEEVAGFLFVWVIFLGASLAYRSGNLIGITWFVDRLPARMSRIVRLVRNLAALVFLIYLVAEGIDATLSAAGMETTVLRFSWGWIYAALPVGLALLAVSVLRRLLSDLRTLRGRPDERAGDHDVSSDL